MQEVVINSHEDKEYLSVTLQMSFICLKMVKVPTQRNHHIEEVRLVQFKKIPFMRKFILLDSEK